MKMVVTRARGWMIGTGLSLGLAALAGCGGAPATTMRAATPTATFSIPTATPTPHVTTIASTGAPTAGPTPTWTKAALPAGFGLDFHVSDIEPAPSDGSVAYACAPVPAQPPSQAYAVVTSTGGARFGPETRVSSNWGSCASVVVDEADPQRAIAYPDFYTAPGARTTDGGATWNPYSGPSIRQMTTISATTYAVQTDTNGNADTLIASTDGMSTWHSVSLPNGTGDYRSASLWAQPSGNLLLETAGPNTTTYMWQTANSGATWAQVVTPGEFYPNFVYATAGARGAWVICGMYNTSNTDATMNLACTTDSGANWTALPTIGDGGQGGPQLASVTPTGAVLATANDNGSAPTLYRWSPGATRWQSLGALPPYIGTVRYYPTTSGGVLWAFVYESDGAGAPPPANDIYSAPYPAE